MPRRRAIAKASRTVPALSSSKCAAQVHRGGVMRDPAIGELLPLEIGADDRTPNAFLGCEQLGGRADLAQARLDAGQLLRAFLRPVAVRPAIHRLEDDHIARVDIGVRETPGDPAVASRDDRRGSRQSDAGDVKRGGRSLVNDQPRPVSGVGDAQAKMHVVGDDRGAARAH